MFSHNFSREGQSPESCRQDGSVQQNSLPGSHQEGKVFCLINWTCFFFPPCPELQAQNIAQYGR